MKNNMMLHALEQKLNEYRIHHPATADMDFSIVRAHCAGKTAVAIALEIPCSESTVYRAVRRVKEFLSLRNMPCWFETLEKEIAKQPIQYGDWNAQSLLEMLYVAYTDYNRIDIGCAKSDFVRLQHQLSSMSAHSVDSVLNTVCDLCLSHERAGFTEGVKVGVLLGNELAV